MTLVFVDDATAADFAPFSLTRPVCELRAGAELVRRRWEKAFGLPTTGFLAGRHLADFDEPGAPAMVGDRIQAGAILVNARCAIELALAPADAEAWSCDGRVAAVRLTSTIDPANPIDLDALARGAKTAPIHGDWIDHVWDYIRLLPQMLAADIPRLADSLTLVAPTGVTRLGQHALHVERGAVIEPMVVVDASAGAVLVRSGAVIQSFTRLVGPCMIGEDVVVNGGRIATSSIGERSRVAGEVSTSIFTGYANKAHDGFIGHSVLGRWVNLGASTVNSNLKNTYGAVSIWTPAGFQNSGLQFLGTLFGDHVKTAIGTRLNTGSVVGAGASVFGTAMPPKYVPPFSWGTDDPRTWKLDAFLSTAERVLKRRDIALSDRARRQLELVWRQSTGGAG